MTGIIYNWTEEVYEDGEVYQYNRGHQVLESDGWKQFIGWPDETDTLKLEHIEYTVTGFNFRNRKRGQYEYCSSVEEAKALGDLWLTQKGLI